MDNSTDTTIVLSLSDVSPDGLELASEFTSLACITVLAVALGVKTYGEQMKSINYGRVLVILLYTLSWAFAVTSVVVVSTNNSGFLMVMIGCMTNLALDNMLSCTLGMLSCDFFYAGSKIVAYAWLIERVHLVTAVKTTRMKTAQYKFHILLLCPYIIIFALMLSFRNIYLEADGTCMIGLQDIASIPLLVYDFIFNLYLTWLFMRPLTHIGLNTRTDWKVTRLYKLARRTLVASIMCLSVSFINVLCVVMTHGHQRGLICLTMCTVDVTVNVVTVHWVTAGSSVRTKTHHDDHVTADMAFDSDDIRHHEKLNKFDGPMIQPGILDDVATVGLSCKK